MAGCTKMGPSKTSVSTADLKRCQDGWIALDESSTVSCSTCSTTNPARAVSIRRSVSRHCAFCTEIGFNCLHHPKVFGLIVVLPVCRSTEPCLIWILDKAAAG